MLTKANTSNGIKTPKPPIEEEHVEKYKKKNGGKYISSTWRLRSKLIELRAENARLRASLKFMQELFFVSD